MLNRRFSFAVGLNYRKETKCVCVMNVYIKRFHSLKTTHPADDILTCTFISLKLGSY